MKQEALIGTAAPLDALTVGAIGILAYMLGNVLHEEWRRFVSWSSPSFCRGLGPDELTCLATIRWFLPRPA